MALSGQTVISDLDKTLKQLLQLEFGTSLPFDLSFAIPDKNFTPVSKTRTTLDCYLYEINEDRELHSVVPILQRNIDGTIDRVQPPTRIKLSTPTSKAPSKPWMPMMSYTHWKPPRITILRRLSNKFALRY